MEGLWACSYTGVGLFYKMQTSFGSLTVGYGPSNHIFPLAFGETGSFYTAVSACCSATPCLPLQKTSGAPMSLQCMSMHSGLQGTR